MWPNRRRPRQVEFPDITPIPWITLLVGIVLLLASGDALVRGSMAVAARRGVSRLLFGHTLVGFGTSMPELMASLQAALGLRKPSSG